MWRWFGRPGHFIGADDCRFHLHTHVGEKCVSTVGEYRPDGAERDREIGFGRLYETMVFCVGADDEPIDWQEVDMLGYNDVRAAEEGHVAACVKYSDVTVTTGEVAR